MQVSSLKLAVYPWLARNLVVATHDVASRHKRGIQSCPKLLPNIAGTQDIADMISAVWEGVNCLLAALLSFSVCPSRVPHVYNAVTTEAHQFSYGTSPCACSSTQTNSPEV